MRVCIGTVVWVWLAVVWIPAGACRAAVVYEGPGGPSAYATNRTVRIWVPPGYRADRDRRYPVLYVQDGENAFSSAGTNAASGWGSWELDTLVEGLIRSNRMSPVILVAVDSSRQRSLEYRGPAHAYTPGELAAERRAPVRPGDSSAYEAYRQFLIGDLKPRIDAQFRTLRGPATTGLMGASLGGVVSLALAFERPEVFGRVACLSGTFHVEREEFLARLRGMAEPPQGLRVFLDSGRLDRAGGDDGRARTDAVASEFRRLGWRDGREFLRMTDFTVLTPGRLEAAGLRRDKWDEAKRSQDNEFYWRRRVWRALEFLFPPALEP